MNIRALMILSLLVLAGCASKKEPEAPPVVVPQSTWVWVDRDIVAASQTSAEDARSFAANQMTYWRGLVHERADTDFIPWYSGYWTQQWLGMKVTWYNVREAGESEATINRLAVYLQEEYQDRVLDPVAMTLSPVLIREQTTGFYVDQLGKKLQDIPLRYAVPQDQFDQRLQTVTAIDLMPAANHSASLYQLVHAKPLGKLPAYKALTGKINAAADNLAEQSSGTGISAVARRAGEKLESQLVTRGAASTVSTFVGKAASLMISVGASTYGVVSHQFAKPEMEAQLRQTLNAAFDEDWQLLLNNREGGVMAGVNYLSAEIEGNLLGVPAQPLTPQLPADGSPAPEQLPLEYRSIDAVPVDYLEMFKDQ